MSDTTTAERLARIEQHQLHQDEGVADVKQKMDKLQNSLDEMKDEIRSGLQKINERMDSADRDRDELKKDVAGLKPEVLLIRDSITFAKFGKRVFQFLAGTGILGFLYAKWELLALLWRK